MKKTLLNEQQLLYLLIFLLSLCNLESKAQYVLTSSEIKVDPIGFIDTSYVDNFDISKYQNGNIKIPAHIYGDTIRYLGNIRGKLPFQNKGIKGLTLPTSAYAILDSTFKENQISNLIIPEGMIQIGKSAFENNKLSQLNLPSSVTEIHANAFGGNPDLTEMVLPVCNSSKGHFFTHWTDENNTQYKGGDRIIDFTLYYKAQFVPSIYHTLQKSDVTVNKGAIISYANNTISSHITIPVSIDGQEITRIEANVFPETIEQVFLPTPRRENYIGWLAGTDITYKVVDSISDVTTHYDALFSYTLEDNDVDITAEGTITAYHKKQGFNSITIPDTLNGQEVLEIQPQVFAEMKQIVLPSPKKEIFIGWESTTGTKHDAGDTITLCSEGYHAKFEEPVEHTLFDSCVEMTFGAITACRCTQKANRIIIPDTLQGFEVVEIKKSVFSTLGISAFKLPFPKASNFVNWESSNGDLFSAGTWVNDTTISYVAKYDSIKPYTLKDEDVTITEKGELKTCSIDIPFQNLIIPDTLQGVAVKTIEGMYFFVERGIQTLQLPSSLETLGDHIFLGNKIQQLILPKNLRHIGVGVFNNNVIEKINGKPANGLFLARKLDGSIDSTTIVSYGGKNKSVDFIPNTVTTFAPSSFGNCELITLTLPPNLLYAGEYAMNGNLFTSIQLPSSESWANSEGNVYPTGQAITNFDAAYARYRKHTITDSEVTIKEGHITSFTNTTQSGFLQIPDTLNGQEVIGIRKEAFSETDVHKLYLPTHKNKPDFKGWLRWDAVSVSEKNGQFPIYNFKTSTKSNKQLENNYLAKLDVYTLTSMDVTMKDNELKKCDFSFLGNWHYSFNKLGEYIKIYDVLDLPAKLIIPDTLSDQKVMKLGESCLKEKGIKDIVLPKTLKTLGERSLQFNLFQEITIPAEVEEIESSVFWVGIDSKGIDLQKVIFAPNSKLKKIGQYAFAECRYLNNITFPQGLEEIDYRAFWCSGLTSVVIPKSVKTIGFQAFLEQSADLTSVVFEDNSQLLDIKEAAFANNRKLKRFRLPSSALEGFHYWSCSGLGATGATYQPGDTTHVLTGIYKAQYDYVLKDRDLVVTNNTITRLYKNDIPSFVIFPDTIDGQAVKKIIDNYTPQGASMGIFRGRKLKEIQLPSCLEYIPVDAFMRNNLKEVDLPSTVVHIGECAFHANDLTSITLPNHSNKPGFIGWMATHRDGNKDSLIVGNNGVFEIDDFFNYSYDAAYQFSFVGHDGTVLKVDTVKHYLDAEPPIVPIRDGYSFTGWNKPITNISEGGIITAQYKEENAQKTYTVQFLDWNNKETTKVEVKKGETVSAPQAPNRTGYHFTQWDTDFSNITSNLVVQAEYEINQYKVVFNDWDGTQLKTEQVNYNEAATPPTEPEREGYLFKEWDNSFTNISKNLIITAVYTEVVINTYTIQFLDWNKKEITKVEVKKGETVSAPLAPDRTGYHFTQWDTDFSSITSNVVVKAQYEINQYTVVFTDWDGTQLKTEYVHYNEAAQAPAQPQREGYTFTGWDKEFIDISKNVEITALYELTTAINQVENSNLSIQPNPIRNGMLTMITNLRISEVRIINLDGICVISDRSGAKTMDVSSLPTGIYLLEVNREVVKKIRIIH